LLFPSKIGVYPSPNVLSKPIVEIADVAKISKHLSPYFMRRTFESLPRGVRPALSGASGDRSGDQSGWLARSRQLRAHPPNLGGVRGASATVVV
jgi:hypothetical protein